MPTYRITIPKSILWDTANLPAFAPATAGTLIIDPDAFVFAFSPATDALALGGVAPWNVQVNGSVYSETSTGIFLASSAEISSIAIGAEGWVGNVASTAIASIALLSPSNLVNLGTISSVSGTAVFESLSAVSNTTLTNAGLISGQLGGLTFLGDSNHRIENSGVITSPSSSISSEGGAGVENVINSGTLTGDVRLGAGHDRLKNSGTVDSIVFLGDGNDSLSNSGIFKSPIFAQNGDDAINNSGRMANNVALGDGNDTLINSGEILQLFGGSGNDVVTNFKLIGKALKHGSISFAIDLGDGDDVFNGGDKAERISDGNGADLIKLGRGNDTYLAWGSSGSDGNDRIAASKGVDFYNAELVLDPMNINLDTRAHANPAGAWNPRTVAANTAQDLSSTVTDAISGFENARGGAGQDAIFGTSDANVLEGNGDHDELWGLSGNDILRGGDGDDFLVGGAGRDVLTGNAGADTFWYFALSHSGVTKATRDRIMDFTAEDLIDLSGIDAISGGSDDAFTYINVTASAQFTGTPGELRSYLIGSGRMLEGDVDGDAKADFSIAILAPDGIPDTASAVAFSAGNGDDFVL